MSVISNFSVIPVRWRLTVDSEMASFQDLLVFFENSCHSRKNNCLIGEFDSIFRWKTGYHTHPFVVHAISRFFR